MNPRQIDDMSWAMAEVYASVTDRILVNLAKYFPYIKDGKEPKNLFDYQARMLAQVGQVNRETAQIIIDSLGGADEVLRENLEAAIMDALKSEDPVLQKAAEQGFLMGGGMVPPDLAPNQTRAFQAYYRQSADKLNLVNTVMLESTQAAYTATVADVTNKINRTQSIMNTASGEVVSGVSSLNEAVRDAVDKMVKNGITGFVDHGGHRWSPEAYVAMDTRTTLANTARAAVWEEDDRYGVDMYQVSHHDGARPLCYPWQGKVISRNGFTGTVKDGDGNTITVHSQDEIESFNYGGGLFGVNCGHYPISFIPGFSRSRPPEQNEEENRKEYEASQQQRGLERKLREERRDLAVLKAQGAPQDMINAQSEKVKEANHELDSFCDETGRARRKSREGTPIKASFPDPDTYNKEDFPTDQRDRMRDYFSGRTTESAHVPIAEPSKPDWFNMGSSQEIAEKLGEQLGVPVDFSGMHPGLAARTARLYTDLSEQYGFRGTSIEMSNARTNVGSVEHKMNGDKKIRLSRQMLSSPDKTREQLSGMMKRKELLRVQGGSILDYMQTHEFAHLFGSYQFDMFDNYQQDFWGEVFDAFMEAKNEKYEGMGKYALKNPDEFLAEGFSDGYLNANPTKYGVRIKSIVDKYFKKK